MASSDRHFVVGGRAGGSRVVRVVTIKWADCPRLRNYFLDFGLFSWTQWSCVVYFIVSYF